MVEHIVTFEESIMPRSTIKNCAKAVLKDDIMIQKEALTALAKGSSVFISYLTTHANEIALSKKRKTIMPNDVFEALKVIEFARFVPDLKIAHEQAERETKEKRERKKSGALEPEEVQRGLPGIMDNDDDNALLPPSKKPKTTKVNGSKHSTDLGELQGQDEEGIDNELDEEDEEDDDITDDNEENEEEDEEDAADEIQVIAPEPADQDVEESQIDTYDEALDNGEDSD